MTYKVGDTNSPNYHDMSPRTGLTSDLSLNGYDSFPDSPWELRGHYSTTLAPEFPLMCDGCCFDFWLLSRVQYKYRPSRLLVFNILYFSLDKKGKTPCLTTLCVCM